jgi:hypothetical protein
MGLQVENRLAPTDIAQAIRTTLAGTQSKAELGRWAFLANLDNDTGKRPFLEASTDEIYDIIYDLMLMEEGPQYELSDDALRMMLMRLDALESSPHHSQPDTRSP